MTSPAKFAHVVLRSNDLPRLRDWYATVLEARVVFENAFISFLTYDDEHHRIAIVSDRKFRPPPSPRAVDHVAFTYAGLQALLDNHARLAAVGIEPYWTINHGPTTSFYYRDPGGNGVELQVDNYRTNQELDAFFRSSSFAANPIGIDVDVEQLRARLDAGELEAALLLRADVVSG